MTKKIHFSFFRWCKFISLSLFLSIYLVKHNDRISLNFHWFPLVWTLVLIVLKKLVTNNWNSFLKPHVHRFMGIHTFPAHLKTTSIIRWLAICIVGRSQIESIDLFPREYKLIITKRLFWLSFSYYISALCRYNTDFKIAVVVFVHG